MTQAEELAAVERLEADINRSYDKINEIEDDFNRVSSFCSSYRVGESVVLVFQVRDEVTDEFGRLTYIYTNSEFTHEDQQAYANGLRRLAGRAEATLGQVKRACGV